ncbi:MAG: PAS domain S-box protein [Rhodobacteraceae bacterium]|nr:PAS domain S-box protein [Paracoccaceae bacterium]
MKTSLDISMEREHERLEALNALTEYAGNVSEEVTNALLIGSAFKGAITLDPNLTQTSFSRFAKEIVAGHEAVINVATIRDYTIEFVHPYADNAHVVGRKLSDIPAQKRIAEKALQEDRVIFQGPVPLLQGFSGFVLRVPVVLDAPGASWPWGLVSIVFSAESLLKNLDQGAIPDHFDVAMRRADDNTPILGDQGLFDKDGITKTIEVPNGAWSIAVYPKGGWAQNGIDASTVLIFLLITVGTLATTNMLFRLRHEAAIRTEQLRAAIDVMGDGFVLYDAEDRLVICNERYREIYSSSAPAIKPGVLFREILEYGLKNGQYEEAAGREEEWLEERMAAHLSSDFTLEQKLDNGRWLRVREMATPDGGRVGIRVDITEQVESRKRAEVAETRLREAIDTVPAAFLLFDAEGTLEIVNTQALQFLPDAQARMVKGTPVRKLLERLVVLEMPHEGGARRKERVEHLLTQLRRTSSQFDLHIGNERYYKIVSHRTQEGGVVCFGLDISDLIAQERWLETTNRRLRAAIKERDSAEARFADVADIATEWFWEQDEEMRLTYLSPGFGKATGASPDKALGQKRERLAVPGQDNSYDEHLRLMEAHEPFENVIYRSNMRGDQETWFRTSGKPVFDENGNFRGYIGTAADVTDLYVAVQKAKKADAAKTQFLNMVSHELRTPMTVVLGYNAFLRKPEALPLTRAFRDAVNATGEDSLSAGYTAMVDEIRGLADKIDSAGKQLQALIGDVLDLSRIESNTLHIDLGPIEFGPIVETTITQLHSLAQGKKIALKAEIEDATLKCDETRLRQVLINLISNAIKFTDQGSITVKSRIEGDMMRIAVVDTGLGIPQEALENIFDRFTQGDASSTRNEGGAGLGLSISKDIVNLHGGKIAVEKTSDKGTTIFFTIPLWKEEEAA